MTHGGLLHLAAILQQYERGEETVHTGEEGYALGVRGLHHFEGATRVGHTVARHHTTETVGKLTLKTLKPTIFTSNANTEHEGILVGIGQQEVEILGGSLQIGVYIAHQTALGIVDTRLHRGTQATVLGK